MNVVKKTADEKENTIHWINRFKQEGIHVLSILSEKDLISIVSDANKAYYNNTPLLTDNEFDIIKEYIEEHYPSNTAIFEIGAPVERNKVKLPYFMGSMNKIKPDTGAIDQWKKTFQGPYVLSCKLDGVSGMYVNEGKQKKLYTRGNGIIGQDISHLIPYLRLPKTDKLVIRGEFIIPKIVFEQKYKSEFSNPRNMVAGIINHKTIDDKIKDIHFVAYELIRPHYKPSHQMKYLSELDVETVFNQEVPNVTNELLSALLIEWRKNYMYEIDGVIVTDDHIYERKQCNPESSFAFKMVLSDQVAEAKVVDVIWTPSKDGYLKPRVQIEPIHLGGVKIEYATGFNAAFIEQNKIGVGALIQIIRSGDVIPYIQAVTVPAETAKMPSVSYKWNDTHVDIIVENMSSNMTVREKNVTGFFRGIGVEGLSTGNVSRLIQSGYDTVPKILHMEMKDFLGVEGFQQKMAAKLYEGIKEKIHAASLVMIMSASNIFGRGFSEKRLELIMNELPNILVSTNESDEEKAEAVAKIKGMAKKTATSFVEQIPEFIQFMKECHLEDKLHLSEKEAEKKEDSTHPLFGKSIVMTGFRDKELMEQFKQAGVSLGTKVSKNTFLLLVKDKEHLSSSKVADAEKLGVLIYTVEEFKQKYHF